jgi:hypothetical protein
MIRAIKFVMIVLCMCCLASCDEVPVTPSLSPQDEVRFNINEGISGYVLFWEGDFMPTFPGDERDGRVYPVFREVCFFTAILSSDVEWSYVEVEPNQFVHLVTDIPTEPVAIVWSDVEGHFEVALPPGKYSIFVREYGYLYANMFDGDGYIFPIEVADGEVTKVQFDITYMAAY